MPDRRKYSAGYKQEAVALVRTSDVPARQGRQGAGDKPEHAGPLVPRSSRSWGRAFQGQGKPSDEGMTFLECELVIQTVQIAPGCGKAAHL